MNSTPQNAGNSAHSSRNCKSNPGKDLDSRTGFSEEMRALYKEKGVKTSSTFLSLDPDAGLDGLVPSVEPCEFHKVGPLPLVGQAR